MSSVSTSTASHTVSDQRQRDADKAHLFVATPCYGGLLTQRYMQATVRLLQVASAADIDVTIELLGNESLITRGRNALVSKFLETGGATHIMFIDSDIAFDPSQIMRMLAFDEDVVAGMYPLKCIDWDIGGLMRATEGEALDTAPLRYVGTPCEHEGCEDRDGFVTGLYAGGGFMLIKRDVILRMIEAYPETRYSVIHTQPTAVRDAVHHALFDCLIEPDTGHYLSEDYAFCRRWRQIGGKVWLDTQGRLTHVGAHEFVGQPGLRFAPLLQSALRPETRF